MSVEVIGHPTIALTYRRISKDDEGDELGIQRQQHALAEYAERQGWVIGAEYVDNDVSASKGKRRPGYEALLRAVEAGEADVVLVTEMSRLTRHPRELEELVTLVEKTGIQITALRAGSMDLTTSGGRLVARMLGAAARGEVEQMAERIAAKIKQNARAGLAGGGSRPFGYDRTGTGTLKINEAEADVIRWATDRVLDDGWAINRCCVDLNRRGVPTSTGSFWRDRGLRMVLVSPRIAGLRPVGTKDQNGRERVPDHHQATWEPIIPRERWERLRATLAVRPRGRRPRSFLLSGFLFCGRCGYRLHSHATAKDSKLRRRRYRCEKGVNPNACSSLSVEADAVEHEVVARVLEAASGANIASIRMERRIAETQSLVTVIADDEALLTDLAADLGARRISRAEWLAARPPIEERLRANRDALQALGGNDGVPPELVSVDAAGFEALDFEAKRGLLAMFIDRVIIDPARAKGGPGIDPARVRVSWRR